MQPEMQMGDGTKAERKIAAAETGGRLAKLSRANHGLTED
jgi:hypothetical protein